MERRADFQRFWKEKGDMVLAVARYMGLPVYELNRHMPEGIPFHQVRYSTKKGKKKTKWVTDKPLKKKQEILAGCLWTIIPAGIYSTKRSLDPKDQRYGYLIKMTDEKGELSYSAMVEVGWDGSTGKQIVDIGKEEIEDIRKKIPVGFRYPKAMIAKLNRGLVRFFWADLWCGSTYAAWYRPEDGVAVYMGSMENSQEVWGNGLTELLQSSYGNVAAVLLLYACFSLLRPWFVDYPALNSKSPYFEVKKKLPKLLALNASSRDLCSAEQLAEFCCGTFQRMGDGEFPIYDGVTIQKFPKKQTALNENEFERKVLQSANVLWVNRRPSKGLKKENRILDLQVPPGFQSKNYEFEMSSLIRALTRKVSDEDLELQRRIIEKDRRRQIPVAIKALKALRKLEEKWGFEFQDVDIESEYQKLREIDFTENIIDQIVSLQQRAHLEIMTEAHANIESLNLETKKVLSDHLREMRKIHKENVMKENFLAPYYERAQGEMREVHGVKSAVLDKIIFLWASAQFFITLLPERERPWIKQKMFQALTAFAKQQKEPWSASEYLEGYLLDEIRDGHCARIRGEGSDNEWVSVWYDPRNQILLLPARKYYEQVLPYIKEPQMTRRIFEKKLAAEEVLVTVKRGEQLRRTYEVKVQIGAPPIPVLKIPLNKFWEKCRKDRKIMGELRKLCREQTPLRAH